MSFLDRLDPPIGQERRRDLALFFVGASLCLSFMLTDPRRPHIWFLVAALTLARAWSGLGWRGRGIGRAVVLLFTAFFVYEAITFGLLLGWVTPLWVRLLVPILLVAAWVKRLPISLGLGLWIVMCLLGWRHQDGVLRCADLRRVQQQKNVSLVVPTTLQCRDEEMVTGRYPRRLWEAPEGGRLLVTTQFLAQFSHPGTPIPTRYTGSICEVKGENTRCLGEGTAQAIREWDDRLYVAAYQQHHGGRGVIYALSKADPMNILVERHFRDDTGEFYLDPKADLLGVPSDQTNFVIPVRASDLTPGTPIPAAFDPGDTRYDPERQEGVFCFAAGPLYPHQGSAYASVAFQGAPFRPRLLAPSSSYPSSWLTMTWGCDWDPPSRRVFVASANLGWLGVIDFDSGRYLARHFIGFGARAVTWDAKRRLVYLGDFLRGEVFAVDPDSGRETARWFAGRFVRQIVLGRDGESLYVTSNAGVVRIQL